MRTRSRMAVWRNLLRRNRLERDLDDELRATLDLLVEEKVGAGMSRDRALRTARLELGAIEAIKDNVRDVRAGAVVETCGHDLRYAFRLLRRNPVFAVTAVLSLAIGIGANTAMFAVVHALLVKPLPFESADRLMLLHLLVPDDDSPLAMRELTWSYPKYRRFLEAQQTFEASAIFDDVEINLTHVDEPERLVAEVVTEGYPGVLGIAPALGRGFTDDEAHRPGSAPVAVISEGLWRRRFGSDPLVVGKTIYLNAGPYTIVGVLPRGFRGVSGHADLWVPLAVYDPISLEQALAHSSYVVARRRADVTEAAARAEMQRLGPIVDMASARFGGDVPWSATAISLSASRADPDVRRTVLTLLAAVGLLLLIACINLTAVFAAKAMARRGEVAIRLAIGASRGRIARQFVSEALVLAVCGAAVGLIVAKIVLATAAAVLPDAEIFFRGGLRGTAVASGTAGLTRIGADMIALDGATLLFSFAVALGCALVVACMPALQSSFARPIEVMKREAGRGRGVVATRPAMLVAQIALALVLLAGAGLMLQSVWRLQSLGAGVDPHNVVTVRLEVTPQYSRERTAAFFTALTDRIRELPGVEGVGLSSCIPASGGCGGTIIGLTERPLSGSDPGVGAHQATPEYFSTMGIRLLRGRHFAAGDRAGTAQVMLVNETAARTLWAGRDPIGQRVGIGLNGWSTGVEVVGIVSDVRYDAIETPPRPDVYIPFLQESRRRMQVFVRSSLDPRSLIAAIRRELRGLDANVPMYDVRTMEERFGNALWRSRATAWLLTAFASVAVLLAAIGIFGVMMQTVNQRAREFAVRLALGAQPRSLLAPLLGRAALVTLAGLAIGSALALSVARLIGSLLYDVQPHDPATFAAVGGLLGLVALMASYIPARRALRVDAIAALRAE